MAGETKKQNIFIARRQGVELTLSTELVKYSSLVRHCIAWDLGGNIQLYRLTHLVTHSYPTYLNVFGRRLRKVCTCLYITWHS